MAPSNFGYSIKEAFRHFFRNWTTSFGAVITIFLSLFIIGLFIVGSVLINSAMGSVEDQVTIQAYIADSADDADVEAFQNKLERMNNVKHVEFISKEQALEEYSSSISSTAEVTMSALDGQNPLPRSYRIEMEDPSQVEEMAETIKADSDFRNIVDDANAEVEDKDADVAENVRYGQEEVSRLFQLTDYIRIAAVVLVALLTFVAFIFINNTIRLSITARRREIAIMRLVGASNGFIRGPFITEGVLQALLGALLSIGALELFRNLVIPRVSSSLTFLVFGVPAQIYYATYGSLILIGVLIGLFGSMIAMRRYLKV